MNAEIADEWRLGWRIAGACAIANATGISLLFYTFSIFLIPIARELGLTRGETGMVQMLIITAALGAPLIGRLVDLKGFRQVFIAATAIMTAIELYQARYVGSLGSLGASVAAAGLIGGGASSVLLTKPINAHFRRHRGLALGVVAAGASIGTIIVPPLLEAVIHDHGWRWGFVMLAGIAVVIGLPLVLALMPREASTRTAPAPGQHAAIIATGPAAGDKSFLGAADFWLLAIANVLANVAVSGAISQLSPMAQDKGLSPAAAAIGLSAFAAGQFAGKLGGGWLLDKLEPRLVAAVLTAAPGLGFAVFLGHTDQAWPVLAACALLGLLQGADVGIFAFFVARRFGTRRYGTAFGALHGLGWIGTAIGIGMFGLSFDATGSYALAQGASIVLLLGAAAMFVPVRLRGEDEDEDEA